MQLSALAQQQQLRTQQIQAGEIQLQQARQAQAEQQGMMELMKKNQGDLDKTYEDAVRAGTYRPETIQALQMHRLDYKTKLASATEANLKIEAELGNQFAGALDMAKSVPVERRADVMNQQIAKIAATGADVSSTVKTLQGLPDLSDKTIDSLMPTLIGHNAALAQEMKNREAQLNVTKEQETVRHNVAMEGAGKSDTDRYENLYLKAHDLPDTPANRMKAFDEYTQKTKLNPAAVRIEGLAQTRGMSVTDTKTGQTMPMSWADYNKASKAEPGRYSSPQFDPDTQMSINAWRSLAPGGKVGTQVTSYGTFLQHTGDLYDSVKSLDNTNFPFMNKSINWMRNNSGDPRVKAFLAKLDPVKKEFESFLLNNRALYEDDRKDAQKIIDENASPAQMLGVLPSLVHTGKARLDELNASFNRATGEDIPNAISPKAKSAMDRIGGGKEVQIHNGFEYTKGDDGLWHKGKAVQP